MAWRLEKTNEAVKRLLSEIFLENLSFKKGVFVTITKVDTASDFRYTRVSVSVFPEKETVYVQKTLKREAYKIQGILNKKLSIKPFPRVEFRTDLTESKAAEIEEIFKKIKQEKNG